ncbi:hypothetical protein AT15_07980 [Kosmotoga arenicorallina S304]|uniref:Gcp-like domain-containing protein n=1 Tax=Kosmotoga arenicorallina S304 TaxID=1453497 RepID=A0A182C7B5_9BACT|nr:tRNA (adenosine(37)-N6)-threonylcarbamoyltransferase complex dimerization subunit type 1 TsaB [Kosmotoga arenicorallina]OAA31425.1 hypothetical protein AT15_07980 [Kosmotoga arenicorallina S304]
MNFLTLDSSSKRLIVGIKSENKEAGVLLNSIGKHGAFLMRAIKNLLEYADLKTSELDFLGCGIGPGSLTGLRVGISTIKGLAYPFNLSVATFCSLDMLAISTLLPEEKGVVARKGREGHYYWRRYRLTGGKLIRETHPAFSPLEELANKLDLDETIILENAEHLNEFPEINSRIARPPSIEDLLCLTEESYRHGGLVDLRELNPYYLQKSVAEINWEKRYGKPENP